MRQNGEDLLDVTSDSNASQKSHDDAFFITGTGSGIGKSGYRAENDFQKRKLVTSLPNVVNVVALRETLLSDAPFITRGNKSFWRRMLDTRQYLDLTAAAFNYVSSVISESGAVDVNKLRGKEFLDSLHMRVMATSLCEIIYNHKTSERDLFFPKISETMTFMIVSSLHTSQPRHHRLFNSKKFRELILDWTSELVTGVRPCNTSAGKEWILVDATDIPVHFVDNVASKLEAKRTKRLQDIRIQEEEKASTMSMLKSKSTSALSYGDDDDNNPNNTGNLKEGSIATSESSGGGVFSRRTAIIEQSSSRAFFLFNNSPLVTTYIDMHATPSEIPRQLSANALKITLSHLPNRPLMTLNPEVGVIKDGKSRDFKVDRTFEKQSLRLTKVRRRQVLENLTTIKSTYNDDIIKMRELTNKLVNMMERKVKAQRKILQEKAKQDKGATTAMLEEMLIYKKQTADP